jgi:hypothetical protein
MELQEHFRNTATCKHCGRPVRHIARTNRAEEVVTCEREPVKIYTQSGREVEGYLRHECGTDNQEAET